MSSGENLRGLRAELVIGGWEGEFCGDVAAVGEVGGETGGDWARELGRGGLAVLMFSPRGKRTEARGDRNDALSTLVHVSPDAGGVGLSGDVGDCGGLGEVGVLSRGEVRGKRMPAGAERERPTTGPVGVLESRGESTGGVGCALSVSAMLAVSLCVSVLMLEIKSVLE